MYISMNIDDWIGDEEKKQIPNVLMLTITFLFCNFMAATQDIAVDGWSLTMLQRHNVGNSATCNSIGFAIGSFLGYVLFIILDSKDFCNKWFRTIPQPRGIISFSDYMYCWALIFIVITTFILFFKKDNSLSIVEDKTEIEMNVKESYLLFWKILKMKHVQTVCWILLTCRMGFGAFSVLARLKLIDAGIPRDNIALFSVPLIPLQVLLPFTVGRFLVGSEALTHFIAVIPCRLVLGTLFAVIMFFTDYFKVNGDLTSWYYALILLVHGLEEMADFVMALAGQAFFSRISDPRYGGTYLTLLNTLSNLGNKWPKSLALFLVDKLTWKKCHAQCKSGDTEFCQVEEICDTVIDGFYVEVFISIIICVLWLIRTLRIVSGLRKLNDSAWKVRRKIKLKNEIPEYFVNN